MKRKPLSSTSLKDLLEEDKAAEEAEVTKVTSTRQKVDKGNKKKESGDNKKEVVKKKTEIVIQKKDIVDSKPDIRYKKSVISKPPPAKTKSGGGAVTTAKDDEKRGKADFQKISVTIEPDMLWLLEDERRRRRVAKMDYSFSEIIREALAEWFKKQGRNKQTNKQSIKI